MSDYTNLQLIEKIVRAKVALESAQQKHLDRCASEVDPDYTGPCTCGADKVNTLLNAVLHELKL
jgi:hypothetical protein